MHIVFDEVQTRVNMPMLRLPDAVDGAVLARGMKTVGLLGTAFTMEKPFYIESLAQRGLTVLVPGDADRDCVHDVIHDELAAGEIRSESRA